MRISDWSSDVCSSDLPTIAITDALVGGPSVDRENPSSYDVYNNFLSANRIRNYGGSSQIDYDLGNMALTSINAFREVRRSEVCRVGQECVSVCRYRGWLCRSTIHTISLVNCMF